MRKPTVEVSAKRRSRVRSGACAFFAVVSVAASQTLPAEVFQSGETVVSDVREYGSGTSLDFAEGATARVQTGGAIRYDGSGNTADAVAMSIGKGSKLLLDGGEVTFTNFTGGIVLEGSEESPAVLAATSGVFTVYSMYSSGNANTGKMTLGDYSELVFDGSSELRYLYATAYSNSYERSSSFMQRGGTVRFRGSSSFYSDAIGISALFSTGYTEFSGSSALVHASKFKNASSVLFGTETTGGTNGTFVVFRDHARSEQLSFAYPSTMYMTNRRKGSRTTVRFDSDSVFSLGAGTYIGYLHDNPSYKGSAEYIMTDGYAQSGGRFGLHIGYVETVTAEGYSCTGRVCVAGGGLMSRSTQGGQKSTDTQFYGTIVGFGPAVDAPSILADATLEVSGGAFTNQFGYFAVGTGRSVGRVLQTGGEIMSVPVHDRPMVIGFAGGEGSFTVSNGVTAASSDAYVGGALTDDLGSSKYRTKGNIEGEDFSRGGAVGKLVVAAADPAAPCGFALSGNAGGASGCLHVGRNGTGLVEVGAGGSLAVVSAVLHGESATLVRTVDGDDAGEFRVDGSLEVKGGAKLVVKVNGSPGRPWIKLLSCGSRTGSFAEADITVEGGDGCCRVVQNREGDDSGSVWLHRPYGFKIVVQ